MVEIEKLEGLNNLVEIFLVNNFVSICFSIGINLIVFMYMNLLIVFCFVIIFVIVLDI